MKTKPFPYKRGDTVLVLDLGYDGGFRVVEAQVTAVRRDEQKVWVWWRCQNGWEVKRCFGANPHRDFGRAEVHPLWQVRPKTPEDDIGGLAKRAKHAARLYTVHREECRRVEDEVDSQARQWRYDETKRRLAQIPHGRDYLNRVMNRMGFKAPKSNFP